MKLKGKHSSLKEAFNRVHEYLRKKLESQKQCGTRRILLYHLYELLPENQQQQRMLPTLEIQIGQHLALNLSTEIRTKTRPHFVRIRRSRTFDQLRAHIEQLRELRLKIGPEDRASGVDDMLI